MPLLILDLDGVLVDSEPLACEVDAELLTRLGFPITPAGVARRFIGTSLAHMTASLEAEHGRPLPADFPALLMDALAARFRTDLRAMPGAAAALGAIPWPRCIASSSPPERIALSLEVAGLAPLVPRRFSAVEVARGKPAPDLFLHAARSMGAAPGACVVVEDAVPGVRAGVAAGMRVIGFVGGGHADPGLAGRLLEAGAAAVVASMAALPAAVLPRAA